LPTSSSPPSTTDAAEPSSRSETRTRSRRRCVAAG
jgi:hypothetical protein